MREIKYPRWVKKMQSIYSNQALQHVDNTVSLRALVNSTRKRFVYFVLTQTFSQLPYNCDYDLRPLRRKCELGLAMAILPGDKPFSAPLLQIYFYSELPPSVSPAKRSGKKQVLNS